MDGDAFSHDEVLLELLVEVKDEGLKVPRSDQVHRQHLSEERALVTRRAQLCNYVTSTLTGRGYQPPSLSTNKNARYKPARPILTAITCRAGNQLQTQSGMELQPGTSNKHFSSIEDGSCTIIKYSHTFCNYLFYFKRLYKYFVLLEYNI